MKTKQPDAPMEARVMTAAMDPDFRILERGEPKLKLRSAGDTIPDYCEVLVLDWSEAGQSALRKQIAYSVWLDCDSASELECDTATESILAALAPRARKAGRKGKK